MTEQSFITGQISIFLRISVEPKL